MPMVRVQILRWLSVNPVTPSCLGKAIVMLREERGMTPSQLAAAAGIDPAALSRIENGKVQPTIETLGKVARGLRLPSWRLVKAAEAVGC